MLALCIVPAPYSAFWGKARGGAVEQQVTAELVAWKLLTLLRDMDVV